MCRFQVDIYGEKEKKNQKKKGAERKGFVSPILFILCVVLVYNSHQMNLRLAEYEQAQTELEEKIDEQKEIKQALEEKADYINSDEYYKELAREKLGLADENDILFKKQNN